MFNNNNYEKAEKYIAEHFNYLKDNNHIIEYINLLYKYNFSISPFSISPKSERLDILRSDTYIKNPLIYSQSGRVPIIFFANVLHLLMDYKLMDYIYNLDQLIKNHRNLVSKGTGKNKGKKKVKNKKKLTRKILFKKNK